MGGRRGRAPSSWTWRCTRSSRDRSSDARGLLQALPPGVAPGIERAASDLGRGVGRPSAARGRVLASVLRRGRRAGALAARGRGRRAPATSRRSTWLDHLVRDVYAGRASVVATSATLTAGGSFDFSCERSDCDEADTLALASPFDYRAAVLALASTTSPSPTAPGYAAALQRALAAARGGRRAHAGAVHLARRVRARPRRSRAPLAREGIAVLAQQRRWLAGAAAAAAASSTRARCCSARRRSGRASTCAATRSRRSRSRACRSRCRPTRSTPGAPALYDDALRRVRAAAGGAALPPGLRPADPRRDRPRRASRARPPRAARAATARRSSMRCRTARCAACRPRRWRGACARLAGDGERHLRRARAGGGALRRGVALYTLDVTRRCRQDWRVRCADGVERGTPGELPALPARRAVRDRGGVASRSACWRCGASGRRREAVTVVARGDRARGARALVRGAALFAAERPLGAVE